MVNGGGCDWGDRGIALRPGHGRSRRRRQLARKAQKSRDALADSGDDLLDRGREMYERGRKLADEAADMFERGRKIVESTARRTLKGKRKGTQFMSSTIAEPVKVHPRPFSNEHVADFSKPANREAMERALAEVRAQLGREYELLIAGRREKTPDKLKSLNPSRPSRGGGHSQQGHRGAGEEKRWKPLTPIFRSGRAVPAENRAEILLRAAALFRERKFEFDAWLVLRSRQNMARSRRRRFRGDRFLRILRAPDAAPGQAGSLGAVARRKRRTVLPAAWASA